MSIAIMSAVWELELPKEQKLVLLAIADHANDDGYCWPSMSRIAWKCGYEQKRTVSDIIRKLLGTQVLVIVEKAHGRTPTKYQIRPHAGARLPEFDPRAWQGDRDAQSAPHDEEGSANSLKPLAASVSESPTGAQTAPQPDAPVDNSPVEVRSDAVEVRSSARRGAVATAPESYNHQQNPDARTRAGPGQSPARASASDPPPDPHIVAEWMRGLGCPPRGESESQQAWDRRVSDARRRLALMNNTARNLAVTPRMPDETFERFDRRINAAHLAAMQARLDRSPTTSPAEVPA